MWTGDPTRFDGGYYTVAGPDWSGRCFPPPLQQPRIPIWVGGTWPGARPFRRAARWDGVVPMRSDGTWSVDDTAAVAQRMRSLRGDAGLPFDVAVPGESDPTDPTRTGRFSDHGAAGATWWIEAVHPWRYDYEDGGSWPLDAMQERISAGP